MRGCVLPSPRDHERHQFGRASAPAQLKIQSAMSGEQRIVLAYEMSMFARELARAGIRRDHPDWTEAQVARELLRLAFFPAPLPAGLNELGLVGASTSITAEQLRKLSR